MVMVVATMPRRREMLPAGTLGILAFDAGKTMCRLLSLYYSLSDREITKLRREVIKSKGVAYLNSQQECFLLSLAAMERLEELDQAAATASCLGRRCSDIGLSRFDLFYADLKLGTVDLRKQQYGTRGAQRITEKMEKLVSATGKLHAAMESLADMEASEKKAQRWKALGVTNHCPRANPECLNERLASQRKQVQHYKESSLWSQTFDKTVRIMVKVICIVYARICSAFGACAAGYDSSRSSILSASEYSCCLLEHRELHRKNRCLFDQYEESLQKRVTRSGPIPQATSKAGAIRFFSSPLPPPQGRAEDGDGDGDGGSRSSVLRLAPPSTVGGAGLSLRYANVILLAERCLHAPATVGDDARGALYEMLPESLRARVRAKLRRRWLNGEEEAGEGDELAEGWRDAVEELMEWLSPVAHDTVRWQAERHMEKKRFETKTTALLLQTLHYSDLEKAEAAIVEVLVGLSCIFWYERRWPYCEVGCKT